MRGPAHASFLSASHACVVLRPKVPLADSEILAAQLLFAESGRRHATAGKLLQERLKMGKYVLAWLLGVPAFVLVIVYLFAH